jgi:hypothetical protein
MQLLLLLMPQLMLMHVLSTPVVPFGSAVLELDSRGGAPPTGWHNSTSKAQLPGVEGKASLMRDTQHPYAGRCPAPGLRKAWELWCWGCSCSCCSGCLGSWCMLGQESCAGTLLIMSVLQVHDIRSRPPGLQWCRRTGCQCTVCWTDPTAQSTPPAHTHTHTHDYLRSLIN